MELIMAICMPYLIKKPVFTMPIKPPAVVEVVQGVDPHGTGFNNDHVIPTEQPQPVKLIGPDPVTGQMPTPYYLPQEVPQAEYAPRPDRPGYDL